MFSNELLLDAGDFDVFGWSSRSSADTENDSDFFVCKQKNKSQSIIWLTQKLLHLLTCWISVSGGESIRGGGGESTSKSDDDELELRLRDLDRDLVLVTLKFDGESHVINDLAR